MIAIALYDAAWPDRFHAEANRIRQKFGRHALRIGHVGSTSVPGLAAKPVIDIQVSVHSLEVRDVYYEWMTCLGYMHFSLGAFDLVYPFFKRPAGWPSTHHAHLCVAGTVQESEHLAFRDYLRCNPVEAAEYSALKRNLASMYDGLNIESQEKYSLAKTEFVKSVLARASRKNPASGPRIDA